MKLLQLQVNDVLCIKGVNINFDAAGNLVVIGGDNDQGKSAVLDCIEMLVSGGDAIPAVPIRRGAVKGEIIGKTEDFTARRTFSATGTKLEITPNAGGKITSPQALWEKLKGDRTLDPCEFMRLNPTEQARVLRELVGIDFTALDQEHATKYAERTTVNRSVFAQQGKLGALPLHPDAPKEEVSVADLTKELQAAQKMNADNADRREALAESNEDVKSLESRLKLADEALAAAQAAVEKTKLDLAAEIKLRDERTEGVAKLVDVATAPILAKLSAADTNNQKVRDNRRRAEEEKEFTRLQKESQALTDRLAAIEKEKEAQLSKAKFPIPGLSFSSSGALLDGLPFEQACTSDQIRASMAMAFAMKPELKVVLVREGSLISEKNLALVESLAKEYGGQVIMERVSVGKECSIIMEDGEVLEDRIPQPALT